MKPRDGSVLPPDWAQVLSKELTQPYWVDLQEFVAAERTRPEQKVYPDPDAVFAAFKATPFKKVRVVVVGQDPYFKGEATGLAFAVPNGERIPPSLRNILAELRSDRGVSASSDLTSWARQGVLLLNTTLTVRQGVPKSHAGQGWETFTDAVISAVSARKRRIVFVLWGESAQRKERLIDQYRHRVIKGAHPQARANAHHPLKGSKPFSAIDESIRGKPIDWSA